MAATCSPSFRASSAHVSATHPAAMTQGISGYLHTLATHRPDGSVTDAPTEADKARAITTLSALVGGMVLARATAEAAPELSNEILEVLQAALLSRVQKQ